MLELEAHHRQMKAQTWAPLTQPAAGGIQGEVRDQGHSFFSPVPNVCILNKVKYCSFWCLTIGLGEE